MELLFLRLLLIVGTLTAVVNVVLIVVAIHVLVTAVSCGGISSGVIVALNVLTLTTIVADSVKLLVLVLLLVLLGGRQW